MARSALTLAAVVTAALPRSGAVRSGVLTEGASGRHDCAVVWLDDGRQVVVRVPTDSAAADELAAEARALRALTPGVRAVLGFRVPEMLGQVEVDGRTAVVVDFIPGYRVDAAQLPPGPGAATGIGAALATVHALPPTVLAGAGLPARDAARRRADLTRLLDRLDGVDSVPADLVRRWRDAVATPELWQFESSVVLGGAASDVFVLDDGEDGLPHVTGVLEWHGLGFGDPAEDLRWVSSAPGAAADVYAAYHAAATRAPDAGLRTRARLYAELEFAKWLLHGVDEGRPDIVEDAMSLLNSLAAGVGDEHLFLADDLDIDEAIAVLGRTPGTDPAGVDTSMQTDAYDAEALSRFVPDAPEPEADGGGEDVSTAPIDISAWAAARESDVDDVTAPARRSASSTRE